jgi:hypothetical protein
MADIFMLSGPGEGQCDERRNVGIVGQRHPRQGSRSRHADRLTQINVTELSLRKAVALQGSGVRSSVEGAAREKWWPGVGLNHRHADFQ